MLFLLGAGSCVARGLDPGQRSSVPVPTSQTSTADVIFEHITEANGLANPVVSIFAEDGDGFLWVGSQSGLQRWDGYRFWSYKQVLGASDSLPDNLVQALYTDYQGRLWLGTSSGGMAMYDRTHDRFIRYRSNLKDLNRVNVFAITGDGGRGLWVGSDTGLDHLDVDSGKFTHMELAAVDGETPHRVSTILREPDGTLWVGTDQGVERSTKAAVDDPRKTVFQPFALPVPKGSSNDVLVLFRDRNGKIWVGTTHGAYVIEQPAKPAAEFGRPFARPAESTSNERVAKIVTGRGPGSEMIATQRYLTIAQSTDGEIWLGTQDEGVLALSASGQEAGPVETWEVRHITHDAATPTSLSDDMVQAEFLGHSGIMWLATRRGISYLDTTAKSVVTMLGGSSKSAVIRDTNVYSVLGRRDGTVWLALSRTGVDILDASGHKAAEIRTGTDHADKTLPAGALNGLAEASDGNVYIMMQRGLFRATPVELPGGKQGTPHVTQVPIGPEASRDVTRLLDVDGTLWIGGLNGLWVYDGKGPARHPEMRGSLTDQRINVLLRGPGSTLWIGTQNGLNRLDLATHELETIFPDASDPTGLGAGYVSSLLIDHSGRLWVGTFSGGVDILENRVGSGRARFRRIINDLPNENIDQLLQGKDGRIWASTDGGIVAIDPKTFEMQVMGRADGAILPAYWNNSGAVAANGNLIYGGIGGITIVRPEFVKPWTYQPPVLVTNARIGDVEIPASRFNSGLQEYPIWIEPDSNNLTVGFTSLDYTAPDKLRYEYKLDNFDKDWVSADATRRLARYTNLPPGNYVLELRGSNRDGVWAPTRQVRIHVIPAWFQTWWFKIAVVLLTLLLLYVMFLLATAYLRRQQRELARQVALRTAELEQMTVELKDSQQKLEHMAYTDALTGLPNRRMFTEHFRRLMALKRRQEASFSVLLMDFDDFKIINDTCGHDAGDFVLVEMASRLSALVRESDCLARLGGDEFGLILGQSHDFEGTESVCRKILESFESAIVFDGKELRTAPSIGIAIYPFDGDTQDKLYKAADLALYHSKRNGGNRCSWSEKIGSGAETTEAR